MASLLETYNAMVKEAEELQPVLEEQNEQMEVLAKYAAAADELLANEYGNNYTKEDVEELATMLINHDAGIQEQQEKVAELYEAGVIMAKAFKAELSNQQ